MDIFTGVDSKIVKGMQEELHFQPEVEIVFVIKGNLQALINKVEYNLKKNDIILFNSGFSHKINAGNETILCIVCYSCELISNILHKENCIFSYNSLGDNTHSYRQLIEIFREIVYHHIYHTHKTDCLKKGLLYKLLDYLIENFLLEESGFSEKIHDADIRICQILQYINQNFRYNISLSELADCMYTSKSTLSRFFKKQIGIYFADYVNQLRLQYAVRQLLYSENNITRIAVDSGFSNLSVFNRTFREHYGMSPTEYRKREKEVFKQKKNKELEFQDQLRTELKEIQYIKSEYSTTINVDVSNGEFYDKKWNKTINVGSMNTLMLANVQYHLIYLMENLGFKYARLWNVFSTKMMLTDGVHIDNYNYDKIDMVLDFMVSHHIIPFLDIGTRPNTAIKTENISIYYEEECVKFQSRDIWENIVYNFINHIVQRYGETEINQWIFELGYDMVHDTHCYEDENYHYFNAFWYLYKTVKKFAPKSKVGGPTAITGLKLETTKEFLEQCKKKDCIPDFVSFMLFPYTFKEENTKLEYRRSTRFLEEYEWLEEIHIMIKEIDIEIKIYISEWNNSISSRNYLNDSCFRATYIVRILSQLWDYIDMICIWMASDWVSNYFDTRGIANGGNGLLTKDTICKPAYHAIAFMNRLGDYCIKKSKNYIITKTDHNSYYILCFNYKWYNFGYFIEDEDINTPERIDEVFQDNNSIEMNIILKNISDGNYVIKKWSVSPKEGNILSEWRRFQYNRDLDSLDVKYIRHACYPCISMERKKVENKSLKFYVQLEPHEITLFHIRQIPNI